MASEEYICGPWWLVMNKVYKTNKCKYIKNIATYSSIIALDSRILPTDLWDNNDKQSIVISDHSMCILSVYFIEHT